SVTIEDECLSTNSDVELYHKNDAEPAKNWPNLFKANFGRISVEILNGSLNSNGSEKGKAVNVDSDIKKMLREGIKFGPEAEKAFADIF
ncbi:576_t:CDS:2, partial [Gigaspora rosea]